MMQLDYEHAAWIEPKEGPSTGFIGSLGIGVALLMAAAGPYLLHSPLVTTAFLGVPSLLWVVYLLWSVFHGYGDPVLLMWVLLFPFGYHFLSYPREQSIVTLDRVVVLLLVVAIGFANGSKGTMVPSPLRSAALAWGCYVLIAAVSMIGSVGPVTLYKVRILLDALVMPALLGWYVVRSLDVRRHLRALHALTCVMIICTSAVALAEIVLGENLLKLPGGGLYLIGTAGQYWVRPDGPFSNDNSLGLIGLVTFCFLMFLRRALRDGIPRAQRFLHAAGAVCALFCSIASLFRSIMLTLVVIVLLDLRYRYLSRSRARSLSVLASVVGCFIMLKLISPAAYDERLSPENIVGRIAQNQQTLLVFLSHPVSGVGFGSFGDAAIDLPADMGSFRGISPVDSPHNNLGSVVAESGLMGFLPFILSQVLLVIAFCRMKAGKQSVEKLVWAFFLYMFLTYWITGMSEGSYYSSDLNLWFMFCLACLYKYALTVAFSLNCAQVETGTPE